jgi:hypothetical protein
MKLRLLNGGIIDASVVTQWLTALPSIGRVQVFLDRLTNHAPISSGTPQSAEAR